MVVLKKEKSICGLIQIESIQLVENMKVSDLINKRGMKVDNRCQTCGMEGESILHVLFQCDPARQAWLYRAHLDR